MAIQLPDFRRQQLPTNRGSTPATQPALRPSIPATPNVGGSLSALGGKIEAVGQRMRERQDAMNMSKLLGSFTVQMADSFDELKPDDFANWADTIENRGRELQTAVMAEAQSMGLGPEATTDLTVRLESSIATNRISALQSASKQESKFVIDSIAGVVEQQLQHVQGQPLNSLAVRNASSILKEQLSKADGVLTTVQRVKIQNDFLAAVEEQHLDKLVRSQDLNTLLSVMAMEEKDFRFTLKDQEYKDKARSTYKSIIAEQRQFLTASKNQLTRQIQGVGAVLAQAPDSKFINPDEVAAMNQMVLDLKDSADNMIAMGIPLKPTDVDQINATRESVAGFQEFIKFQVAMAKATTDAEVDQLIEAGASHVVDLAKSLGADHEAVITFSNLTGALRRMGAERKSDLKEVMLNGERIKAIDEYRVANATVARSTDPNEIQALQTQMRDQLTRLKDDLSEEGQIIHAHASARFGDFNRRAEARKEAVNAVAVVRDIMDGKTDGMDFADIQKAPETLYNIQNSDGRYADKMAKGMFTDTGALGPAIPEVMGLATLLRGALPGPVIQNITGSIRDLRDSPESDTRRGNAIILAHRVREVADNPDLDSRLSSVNDLVDRFSEGVLSTMSPMEIGQLARIYSGQSRSPENTAKVLANINVNSIRDMVAGEADSIVTRFRVSDDSSDGFVGPIKRAFGFGSEISGTPEFDRFLADVVSMSQIIAINNPSIDDQDDVVEMAMKRTLNAWGFTGLSGDRKLMLFPPTLDRLPFGGPGRALEMQEEIVGLVKDYAANNVVPDSFRELVNDIAFAVPGAKTEVPLGLETLDIRYLEPDAEGNPTYKIFFENRDITPGGAWQPQKSVSTVSRDQKALAATIAKVMPGVNAIRDAGNYALDAFLEGQGLDLPRTALEAKRRFPLTPGIGD